MSLVRGTRSKSGIGGGQTGGLSFRITSDTTDAVLSRFRKGANAAVTRVIRGRMKIARRDMVSQVKRKSGKLAAGIELVIPPSGLKSLSQVGFAGVRKKELFYGRFLEFGTSRQKAQPFILPPFTRAMRGVEAEIRKALDK